MWNYKILTGCLLWWCWTSKGNAFHRQATDPQEVRVSKKIAFDFKASPEIHIYLALKYAHIAVMGWAKDSVKVEAEIIATGMALTEANRILERVTLGYDYTPQKLHMQLEIASQQQIAKKNDNPLGNIMNGLVQSLISNPAPTHSTSADIDQHNLKILIHIRLPQGAIQQIENRYGSLELNGNFTGKLTAHLFYGNLKAEKLPYGQLEVSYGEAHFKHLSKATANFRQSSIKIERAGELNLQSSSTTLEIDSIASLWLDSRNDVATIKRAGKLNGKMQFSNLDVGQLGLESNLETHFGNLTVQKLLPSCTTLDVMARATNVKLEHLPSDTHYDIVVKPEKWQAPERLLRLERQPFEGLKGHVRLVWNEGNAKRKIAIENREGILIMK